MRILRWALVALGGVVLLAVAAAAVFLATFDPNAFKPRIADAARQATGRDLALRGEIRLKPSLRPTLAVADVAFANAAWGTRPDMARLASLEVALAVVPLLRGELAIDRIVLIEPDILLETDRAGRGNWELAPAAEPASPPVPPPAPREPRESRPPPRIAIETLRIERGTVTFRDARSGRVTTIGVPMLDASVPADGPIRLDLDATLDGVALNLAGTAGPLARLLDPAARTPFPLDLVLRLGEARLAARGTLAEPLAGRGFDVAVSGTVPDLARLAAAIPGAPTLPPVRGLDLAVSARDAGGPIPELRALTLKAGDSDLAALVPGLRLRALEVSTPDAGTPIRAAGEAVLNGVPLTLAGTLGPLAGLLPGDEPRAPWPVELRLAAAGANATVAGTVTGLATAAPSANARVEIQVPDVAALSPLAGRPLPAVKDAAFAATVAGPDRARRIRLTDLALRLGASDLSGGLTVGIEGRPSVEGRLASRLLDVDALLAALDTAPAAAAPAPPAAPSAAAAPPRTRLIPDDPLPLDALRAADARLALALAEVRAGSVAYTAVSGTIALRNGALEIDPLSATLPGGAVSLRLGVDAAEPEPPVRLALSGPSIELRQLLAAFGGGYRIGGALELDVDVRGSGATAHRIASTLSGHLGIAGANLDIDNRLIDLIAGELWRALVPNAPRDGVSNVRCIALRFDAAAGTAQARALLFDSNLVRVGGSGSVALGPETLALRLSPTLKLAGGGIGVPVMVGGTFLAPSVRVDRAGAVGALGRLGAGAAAGATAGAPAGPLGAIVGGVVGAARGGAVSATEDCATQLAVARGGRAGPLPPPEAEPASETAAPGESPRPAPQPPIQERLPAPLQQIIPGLRR